MRRYLTVMGLIFLVTEARSQEFLNANKNKITKEMAGRGALLVSDQKGKLSGNKGSYDLILYQFSPSIVEKNDIYDINFLIRNDSCYQYLIKYRSNRYLQSLIKKFDNPNSGFKREGKNLMWINPRKDEIKITVTSGDPQNILSFLLNIHTKLGM